MEVICKIMQSNADLGTKAGTQGIIENYVKFRLQEKAKQRRALSQSGRQSGVLVRSQAATINRMMNDTGLPARNIEEKTHAEEPVVPEVPQFELEERPAGPDVAEEPEIPARSRYCVFSTIFIIISLIFTLMVIFFKNYFTLPENKKIWDAKFPQVGHLKERY